MGYLAVRAKTALGAKLGTVGRRPGMVTTSCGRPLLCERPGRHLRRRIGNVS